MTAQINGASVRCKITVKDPVIKLNKSSATTYKGKKYTLKASTSYSIKVTWNSSNNKIATVSSKGFITPKKAGKVTITTSVYGKKVTCKINVKYPTLSVNKTKITLKRKKCKSKGCPKQ